MPFSRLCGEFLNEVCSSCCFVADLRMFERGSGVEPLRGSVARGSMSGLCFCRVQQLNLKPL